MSVFDGKFIFVFLFFIIFNIRSARSILHGNRIHDGCAWHRGSVPYLLSIHEDVRVEKRVYLYETRCKSKDVQSVLVQPVIKQAT